VNGQNSRILSFDAFKVFAILGVICLHTRPFAGIEYVGKNPYVLCGILINQISRVAVPFFFLLSGYLLAGRLKPGSSMDIIGRYNRRVISIFIFWSLVYFTIPLGVDNLTSERFLEFMSSNAARAVGHPLDFLMEGSKYHLWFLVSLLLAVWIVMSQLALGFDRGILWTGAFLFVIGLLAGPYSATPIGFNLHFNTRNGPFFSTLFVAIGWWIARKDCRPKTTPALMLLLFGFCLQLGEGLFLYKAYGKWFTWHDYLVGTVFFGTGALLLALSKPDLLSSTILPKLGKYTLGIYASHILFVEMLRPMFSSSTNPLWDISFPMIVFLVSLSLVFLISQVRPLRPFVL
jgi:surface polysaccharide O-acyltransferase-like enzyme